MVAMRSYKRRLYKKRRTIRKLKTTLRRKIQRGGVTPEEELIRLVIKMSPSILKLVLGNIEPFVRICVLLARMSQMGGRISKSSRLYQTGGALSQSMKDELIQKLSQLKQSFHDKQKMDVVGCIEMIQNKVNTAKTADTAENVAPSNVVENVPTVEAELLQNQNPQADASQPAGRDELTQNTPQAPQLSMIEKFKNFKQVIRDKVKQKIESNVTKLQSILTGQEYRCLLTIKNAVLEDFLDKIEKSSILEDAKQTATNALGSIKSNFSNSIRNPFRREF